MSETVVSRTVTVRLPGDETSVAMTVYDAVDAKGRTVDTFLNQRIAEQYAV